MAEKREIIRTNANSTFTIVKKIAKHGSQAIIVIPKILEYELKTGTIVQLKIDVIKEAEK
jgi:hypothetical protein